MKKTLSRIVVFMLMIVMAVSAVNIDVKAASYPSVFFYKDADFEECIRWLFRRMEEGAEKYPGFFTFHSMSFLGEEKTKAHEKKERSWQYIKKGLYTVLEKDKRVRRDAFNEQFTRVKFVDVIFSMMLAFMLQQAYDSSVVVEIVRRSIYD